MSKPTSILAIISLVLAIIAFQLWQQLRDERALTARRIEAATQAAPALFSMPAAPPAPAPSTDVAPAAAAPPPGPAIAAPQPPPVVINTSLSILGKQGLMQLQYPDLAQQLGLSPAQAEALFDFLMRQQGDLNRIALAGGESGSQAIKEMQANQQHELEAFLGPSDYQKWQAYAPTLEARRRISELTSMVASSGEPITETQKQPLLDTILAEQQRRAQEEQMRAYPTTDRRAQLDTAMQDLKGREESYQRIQDSARNYLTPVQFETMKASMDRQIAMTRNALEQQLAQLENGR